MYLALELETQLRSPSKKIPQKNASFQQLTPRWQAIRDEGEAAVTRSAAERMKQQRTSREIVKAHEGRGVAATPPAVSRFETPPRH